VAVQPPSAAQQSGTRTLPAVHPESTMASLNASLSSRMATRPMHAGKPARAVTIGRGRVVCARAAASTPDDMGFKTMRSGVKVAAEETLLTPRFYTT
jgi:hypothetical protein